MSANRSMRGRPRATRRDDTELGWTGLQSWGEETLEMGTRAAPAELRGARWRHTVRIMSERDPVIVGLLFAVDTLIRQTEWEVRPNDDNPDEKLAEFIDSCIKDMSSSWHDTLSEILSFLPYGWSYHEIVYKKRLGDSMDPKRRSKYTDGYDGWRKWPARSQNTIDRWEFDEDGGIRGMWQTMPDYTVKMVPIERSMLFRTRARLGNPEGPSILNGAYEPWRKKWHIERIESIGIERDLTGIPYAFGPPDMWNPTDPKAAEYTLLRVTLENIVQGLKNDEHAGLVIPRQYTPEGKEMYGIGLMSVQGTRLFDTNQTIIRQDERILTSALADFMILGQKNVGSWSLASTKTNLFSVALGTFLDHIASVINTHAIPRLLRRNGMDVTKAPYLRHGDIENVDIEQLARYVDSLVKAGANISEEQMRYLMTQAGMPLPAEGVATVKKTPDPAPAPLAPPTNPPAPTPGQSREDPPAVPPTGGNEE